MLKLYTEINDLNTIERTYLVDLLKPLLPEFGLYHSISSVVTLSSSSPSSKLSQ